MRLQWIQLQAVVFFIMMLLGINLAFSDSEFDAEKLNEELEPFINSFFGYLPAMPYITVHSVLVSFMVEEYDKKGYRNFKFIDKAPKGFLNDEAATSMATYLQLMRPFRKDSFGNKLTGPILKQIASTVTSGDLGDERNLNSSHVLMPAWTSSFARQCYGDEGNFGWNLISWGTKNHDVERAVLIEYTVSGWHKIQLQSIATVTPSKWNPFLEELATCTEAALRWTVFETVKKRFDDEIHVFQLVLDDFLKSINDNQAQAKLLAYTIQLGVHYHLLEATENSQLQTEFQELLEGSSQVGSEVKKFNHFLAYLGLVNGTFNKEELAFKFEDQDLTEIDVDLNVPGWTCFRSLKPFDLTNTTVESLRLSPFFTIFEGFKQYQDNVTFVSYDVFKWRQVMQFIVSYGHMFKKVLLNGLPIYEVPATNDPPTAPSTEPRTVPPTLPPTALSTAAQSTVTGTGYLNQTQECCNNFSLWKQLLVSVLFTAGTLVYMNWPENTTATSYLANLFGASTTTLTSTVSTSRSGIIIMLTVWAMLVVGGGIGWWYTKSQTETKKKTAQKKKTKANQKVASLPGMSPLSTLAFSGLTPSTSPLSTPVGSSKSKAVFPSFSFRTKTNIAAFKRHASRVLTTTTTTSPARSTVLKFTSSSPSSTSSQTKTSKAAQSSLKQAKGTIK